MHHGSPKHFCCQPTQRREKKTYSPHGTLSSAAPYRQHRYHPYFFLSFFFPYLFTVDSFFFLFSFLLHFLLRPLAYVHRSFLYTPSAVTYLSSSGVHSGPTTTTTPRGVGQKKALFNSALCCAAGLGDDGGVQAFFFPLIFFSFYLFFSLLPSCNTRAK